MILPASAFTLGIWLAYILVACGAAYLLVVLVREWIAGKLW